ncbi:hypothetical protein [Enhygromyxa salina]|uniref:hypothetical protein n=1 Tax=Enhygromyxa salina TaxID=215803 RepID=UPI000D086CBF|nr:hypothetical protein [Enhygromyxa salina]
MWVVVGVCLLLGLASLGNGLLADDLMHYQFLSAHRAGRSEAAWWDMFVLVEHDPRRTIGMRTSGRYPWWVDPNLRIAFFRPLSAATHHLDFWLWPNSPGLMHAHSVVWHAGACAMAWAVARRLSSDPRVAGLAAIFYALSFTHVVPWSWLAHRNGLVSTFWALACLLAHIRWRSDRKWIAGVVAPGLLGAALLSAEGAVVTLAFLVSYELLVSKGRLRSRLLALTPALVTVAAWRVVYKLLGYGALGSGGYIDPIADPLNFLLALPARCGSLIALSVSPPFIPDLPLWLWAASAFGVGIAALVFVLSPDSKRGAARFGLLAASLGCLPLAASFPVDRLLVLTSFGMSLVFAELVDGALLRRAGAARTLGAAWVGVIHLVVPTLADPYVSSHLEAVLLVHSDAHGPDLPGEGLKRKGLIIVHTPDYPAADKLAANRARRGLSVPNFVWILHSGPAEPELECVDESSVVVREPEFGWPVGGFAVQFRNTRATPFRVGDTVRTVDYTAEITEVEDGQPTAVRFQFRARLDHESFVWATWDEGEFVWMKRGPSCEPSRGG